jgi:DNA-binding Lrp family transcriptional regulator
MLTELEKKVIAEIQGDIPVTERPYLEIAVKLGISEALLLATLQDLCDRGVIRRFGATLRHQKSGYRANAMTAWKVPEDRVEEVGRKMATYREVSHCYRRNPAPDWHYNLYTMIHARDEDSCVETVERISRDTGVSCYTVLFSRKELKKTSMKYFSTDEES